MANKMRTFFAGRNGPDTLAKTQLFFGVVFLPAAYLLRSWAGGWPAMVLQTLSLILVMSSLIRVMSRNITLRAAQNARFRGFFTGISANVAIRREHYAQRGDWRFYKCPQCKTWLRVPRGKGKLHISCRCGYVLYRKT